MIWSRFDPLTYQQHSRSLFHQTTMTIFSFEQIAKMLESLRFVTRVESFAIFGDSSRVRVIDLKW